MQSNQLTTGHVFPMGVPGIFGILSYSPETVVVITVFKDEPTTAQACNRLARSHAGRFVIADSDDAKWGKVSFQELGSAVML